jgi:gamma-tubulin complex component 2
MSHEFKVHHLTSQLLQLLQLQHLSPDSYNDTLLQHMTPYVTTQVSTHNAVRKITEYTSKKEEFLQRYSSLKIKHPRELDSLVYLLSKLVENQSLCEFIRARRPPPLPRVPVQVVDIEQINVPVGVNVPDLPPQDTKLTFKQLELLKDQLSTFTSKMEEADKKKKQQKETIRGDYPHVPSWAYKRFYLTSDYTFPSPHSKLLTHPLGTLSLHDQQLSIMDDLLHLMQGSNGRYIVANDLKEDHKRTFNIDRTLDVSLQSLLARMLPLCTHYSLVCRFIQEHSKFKHGTINQALAASMRGLIEEYLLVIAQLEYQLEIRELTLQKMWYYIQPCLHTMELLASIASTIKRARYSRGGRTLSLLHDITVALMGDTQRQRVAIFVTKSSCVPFFEMLSQWLLKGDFDDPYSEFMIEVNRDINVGSLHEEYNDYYWEGRYVGLQENIPTFLEMVAEKILQTGKYLNVVRTCGKKLEIYPIELKYDLNERYYTELIDGAYNHASKQVLDLIMRENDLIGHLDSIKHYFLFDQGDLFVHFMDIAESELQKPISFIPHSRLKSLMELALRTSVANYDRYKDNLRVLLEPYNLKTFLRHVISVQPEYVEHGVPPPAVTRPPSSTSLPGKCINY